MQCVHCEENLGLELLDCEQGFNWPHCTEHRMKCEGCKKVYCTTSLTQDQETGLDLCEVCNDPQIIAEMQCANNGSHRNFKKVMTLRRGA